MRVLVVLSRNLWSTMPLRERHRAMKGDSIDVAMEDGDQG